MLPNLAGLQLNPHSAVPTDDFYVLSTGEMRALEDEGVVDPFSQQTPVAWDDVVFRVAKSKDAHPDNVHDYNWFNSDDLWKWATHKETDPLGKPWWYEDWMALRKRYQPDFAPPVWVSGLPRLGVVRAPTARMALRLRNKEKAKSLDPKYLGRYDYHSWTRLLAVMIAKRDAAPVGSDDRRIRDVLIDELQERIAARGELLRALDEVDALIASGWTRPRPDEQPPPMSMTSAMAAASRVLASRSEAARQRIEQALTSVQAQLHDYATPFINSFVEAYSNYETDDLVNAFMFGTAAAIAWVAFLSMMNYNDSTEPFQTSGQDPRLFADFTVDDPGFDQNTTSIGVSRKMSSRGGMQHVFWHTPGYTEEAHEERIFNEAAAMYDELATDEARWQWMQTVPPAAAGSRGRDYELQRIKEIFVEWGVHAPAPAAEESGEASPAPTVPGTPSPAPTEVGDDDNKEGQ